MNCKNIAFLLVAMSLTACGQVVDEPVKTAPELPGALQPVDKGDWRTAYYTDVRGELRMNDTRYDSYTPLYPNYYNGYEFELQAGDVVDVRVGAAEGFFDPVMGIYGPQAPNGDWGALRAVNDDSAEGGTYDSYLRIEASETGRYLILVQEYSWRSGELWTSLDCVDGPCSEGPTCPYEVLCAIYCENGYVLDEDGCSTCECIEDEDEVCPSVPAPPNVRCAAVVTWGRNPDTGDCCQYPSPCHVPPEFETFYNEEACQGPALEGESCSMAGRQCAEGLECDYQCPDGSDDPNCNLGINPTGTCVTPAPEQCVDGETKTADDGCNTCVCSNGLWACTRRACAPVECETDADCVVTGCSGQICASEPMASTCEWREEYACYGEPTTSCGCNAGQCGWAQTDELAACLGN